MTPTKKILVTGPTGYVGGRLIPRLLEAGYDVRVLARDPSRLQGRPWLDRVEVIQADALDPASLPVALEDVSTAYYLIHGRQGGKITSERDLSAARNFVRSAEKANLERIIYLGELVDPTAKLSPYLRSRHETGYILRQGRVPVTEFRAGMIIGSGSVLFEMVRYLAELQPVFICPSWFLSQAQPIAIRDTLSYLVSALETPESIGKLIEIGGATQLTYADMLLGYSKERGFKRWLIPTPIYAPRLSAYWIHMVTPVSYQAILPMIEGLHIESLVHDDLARKLFPTIEPLDFQTAMRYTLAKIENGQVETSWSDALVTSAGDIKPYQFKLEEGMFMEKRQMLTNLPAESIFRAFTGIGGERGWLYMDWAWSIRGWMDKAIIGVGLRRGRRHPDEIRAGESLDFWRVESLTPNQSMRLRAEMKVSGKAWLEFQVTPQENGKNLFVQTAYFAPRGLLGYLYWYAVWPFHLFVFDGMLRRLVERASEISKQ
ncbi:MAG TPA: SDR family oxidoreductase [Anaerolineales bacterium]|jgi:uncharacterized protein YbjT (DUF2867 family)|nr:SDR family oxidoreductase [Anaerolineales bacterium]HNA87694.1 SDR family oxidoreductase [Anaerolineales bacterium]HNB34655.1 SDR family oxidoreductase [Anaerolineales bacterium]HNJ11969.1 SDR family oxidoreductase [Anaerolineales bacterium]